MASHSFTNSGSRIPLVVACLPSSVSSQLFSCAEKGAVVYYYSNVVLQNSCHVTGHEVLEEDQKNGMQLKRRGFVRGDDVGFCHHFVTFVHTYRAYVTRDNSIDLLSKVFA